MKRSTFLLALWCTLLSFVIVALLHERLTSKKAAEQLSVALSSALGEEPAADVTPESLEKLKTAVLARLSELEEEERQNKQFRRVTAEAIKEHDPEIVDPDSPATPPGVERYLPQTDPYLEYGPMLLKYFLERKLKK